jgi:hypothetical protein
VFPPATQPNTQETTVTAPLRIDPSLLDFPGGQRDAAWWQRYTPLWVDAAVGDDGIVTITPNGKRADGVTLEMTPALRRSRSKAAAKWAAEHPAFAKAIVSA